MRELTSRILRVAPSNATVLVKGESGTGKELVARALHAHSRRKDKPYVPVNCSAIPEGLLESELFGHAKGAFTGAVRSRRGLFEEADGGTLFIDEVTETTPAFQSKLLRVLQDGEVRRVGESTSTMVDVRIVAATNRDIDREVQEKHFRQDLFYRLNVVSVLVPPLRDRVEDIPLLAEHFLEKYSTQMEKPVNAVSRPAMDLLQKHDWPGNIRELENVIERAVALESTPSVQPESLPPTVRGGSARLSPALSSVGNEVLPAEGLDLEARVQEIERGYIAQALERANGVQVKAADLLGMSFRSFRYYVKKYNLR
jgi:two-component system response regulator HydG